ncbi:hypothetical protein F8562_28470 [Klebsiella sp. RCJ4]|nr:hypothetical protein F8562_28470 [Klebsiella sp. RCJ4]RJP17017.1 hypothetical protein DZK29_01555 [Klebsiella michiganensis]
MRRDKYIGAASSRLALRLPGLRVYRLLRAGSPGQAFTPQPGMYGDKYIDAASSRVALRLPGLRVLTSDSQPRSNPGLFIIALFGFPGGATGQLQVGSLGCAGINTSVRSLPGCAYPGQESTAVCGPVARTGAARRLRENPAQLIFARRLRALKAAQLA